MKKALVLGGGVDQLALIHGFRRRGYRVFAVDANAECPGRSLADVFFPISTIDEDRLSALVRDERVDVVGVISSDRPLRVAARLNAEAGHPNPITREQAVAVTEKPLMKLTLESAGVPFARYVSIGGVGEFKQAGFGLSHPMVVKPADSSASRGISLVRDDAEIDSAIRRAREASRSGICVVEEYIEGCEISVDAVVVDGSPHVLLITDGRVDRHPERFGLYLMNSSPSAISDSARARVREIIGRVASHLGIANSLFFFQMIVRGDDVFVIEYSARNAGAAKSRFIRTAINFDVVELYLRLLLGEKIELPPENRGRHASLNFLYGRPGVVGEWRGFDELAREGVISWVEQFKPRGARCEGMRSGADRLGVYALVADHSAALSDAMRRVESSASVLDAGGADMWVRVSH